MSGAPEEVARATWAVVVTYRAEARIGRCLERLTEWLPPENVIVVDNSPDDATARVVEERHSDVRLVRTGANLGFGRACNIGMKRALDAGARHVIQVNDDAVVTTEALASLVAAAERNPEYGFLVPLNEEEPGGGLDPLFVRELRRNARRGTVARMFSDALLGRPEEVYPVSVLPGAVLLCRADCLRELGGCDPLYFVYGSEYDLCRRAVTTRWKVGVVPGSVVAHDYARQPGSDGRARIARSVSDSYSISVLFAKRPDRPFLVATGVALLLVPYRAGLALLVERDAAKAVGVVAAVPGFVAALPRVWRHRRRCRDERGPFLDDIDSTQVMES